MSGIRNPDLQRLLAQLNGSSLVPDTSTAQSGHNASGPLDATGWEAPRSFIQQPTIQESSVIPGLGALPVEDIHRFGVTTSQAIPTNVPPTKQNYLDVPRPPVDRSRLNTPFGTDVSDASIITTWPAALKHVTKYVLPNEKVASRIKHLITEQHKHERQWWAGREAVVMRHADRADNQAKAAELLKSLGGLSLPAPQSSPEADRAELEAYDKKVYSGMTQMAADFDRQLRTNGIPFYAIKHELIILEEGKEKSGSMKGRLDKGELRELQKRMLQTLEDLLGDD